MRELGPDDRSLFESDATLLYEDVVETGGIDADDPRVVPGGEQHHAFELLVELGLLAGNQGATRYVAVDPVTVQSRIVSPLGNEGSRLLQESSSWVRAFAPVTQAWRRAPATPESSIMVVHDDPDDTGRSRIDSYIAGLVADCENEVLTAQPQAGRDPETLAAAAVRDTAMLERGTRMRTLYQHSARRSTITADYVAEVTERGAEVRTLDEFFNRMIVFDHRIAVIPGKEQDLDTAVVIREPSVVDYLVDVFERAWERGRPFTSRDSGMLRDIAAEQRAMTIRMLVEGHADQVSAKRLGVSPRTYAGYVADLKQEYEAETRFQLGYTMGTRGISGRERQDGGAAGANADAIG